VGEGSETGSEQPRPAPPAAPAAVPVNEHTPVAIGTAVWALLFVIGLFIRPQLSDNGREWWIWTAAAGVVLGLFGYFFLLRRRTRSRP
jgi:hypothetical protein